MVTVRRAGYLAAMVIAAAQASTTFATAYTPGDLVALRLDNGGAALVNSGNSIYLDEFTTATGQAAPVSTLTVPNSSSLLSTTMALSTTQTEGELRLSADGTQLSFFGYNAYNGEFADLRKAATRTDIIGAVDSQGVLSYPNTTTDAFKPVDGASHQIRSAYTVDDQNYYISGDDTGDTTASTEAGVRYLASGSSTSQAITSAAGQARFVTTGPDGNLYAYVKGGAGSYASAIVNLGANPTSNVATPAVLVSAGASPNNFAAVDAFAFVTFHTTPDLEAGDLLYLSDDGIGILKYKFDGTTWDADGINTLGSQKASLGMTLASDGTNVTLYAVEGDGKAIVDLVDSNAGSDSASDFAGLTDATLATAPTNDLFRGISFAPVAATPEPASLGLLGLGVLALCTRRRSR